MGTLFSKREPAAKEHNTLNSIIDPGTALGQCTLGIKYEVGMGVKKDYGKAYECYRLSIDKGYGMANTFMDNLLRKEEAIKDNKTINNRNYETTKNNR